MTNLDLEELEELFESYVKEGSNNQEVSVTAQTGILSLDILLGGGIVPGMMEIFGEESVGKTALAAQIVAHAQAASVPVAFLPSEVMDVDYLAKLGVDLTELPVLKVKHAGDWLQSFTRCVLVIDSFSALDFPANPVERNDAMWFLLTHLRDHLRAGGLVIVTSHVRARRSAERNRAYAGGTESSARRLTDLFDVRLELSRMDVSPPKYTMLVNVLANRLSSPSVYLQLPCVMGRGVDRFEDLVRTACKVGALEKRGTYYYIGALRLGPGIEAAKRAVAQSEDLETEIVRRVVALMDG